MTELSDVKRVARTLAEFVKYREDVESELRLLKLELRYLKAYKRFLRRQYLEGEKRNEIG